MSGNNSLKNLLENKLKRRTFLKWSSAIGAPLVLGGIGAKELIDHNKSKKTTHKAEAQEAVEEIISTCSITNCGGRCVIKAHVKDGIVTRVSTDTQKSGRFIHSTAACLCKRKELSKNALPSRPP